MFLLRFLRLFLYSHATQIKDLLGRSWAYHGKGQSLKTYNFKSILTLHRPETPRTDLVSHNIPLHAVSAKSRIKDTANIIYIITPDLKNMAEVN